jgi:transcriptional regulator of NAD metabolism
MRSAERRIRIESILNDGGEPISATSLASLFHVSRQVIVGDIALMRASGLQIQATPRGYLLAKPQKQGYAGTIACRHSKEDTITELYTIIDQGGSILDVIVDHPIYGQLTAQLQIHSRYEADDFIRKLEHEHTEPLSRVTNGIHLHTVLCPDEEAFQRILDALDREGILYKR